MFKRFGMDNAKEIATPMSTACYLDKDEGGKLVDIKKCRGMIGTFLYLSTNRPNIISSVYLCVRYQTNPKETHLSAIKRIMRYLIGTMNISLWYPKGTSFS